MKRKIRKVYKSLPPHTNEAHPVANAGQASKPFIIAVITIVAVVALTLLLLFSDRLVGKAFYTGEANTAGASLPSPAVEGQPFMVAVKANVGNQPAAAISFELTFPSEFICPQTLDLLNWPVKSVSCDSNLKTVKYTAITNGPVSGEIIIANLVFPGTAIGSYEFNFVRGFEVKKPTAEVIVLSVQSPFTVEVSPAPVCGDGNVQENYEEQCDDGNQVSGDGCTAACQIEQPQFCSPNVWTCEGSVKKHCNPQGTNYDATLDCADSGKACVEALEAQDAQCATISPPSVCGNGLVEAPEQCDDGNQNNFDSCNIACMLNPVACGNGIVNSNEQCDDGNQVSGDGCSSVCQTELQVQYTCTGYIPNSHLCTNDDQGLQANTAETIVDTPAGCTPEVKCEGYCFTGYHKEGNSCVANVCGNNVIESGEQCDDNNLVNGDGCSSTCTVELQLQVNYCGDGVVDSTLELCDDGNNVTNDGCSSACVSEAGWNCSGQPSVCVASIQPLTVQGTKITLTDADTEVPALAATKVTATASFSTEITVYTVLYGPNNKVLSIKSEKIETGLAQGATYLATVSYPLANVRSKSVIVFDVEQAPTVFGQLQKSYE